jgi:hypothetical protein
MRTAMLARHCPVSVPLDQTREKFSFRTAGAPLGVAPAPDHQEQKREHQDQENDREASMLRQAGCGHQVDSLCTDEARRRALGWVGWRNSHQRPAALRPKPPPARRVARLRCRRRCSPRTSRGATRRGPQGSRNTTQTTNPTTLVSPSAPTITSAPRRRRPAAPAHAAGAALRDAATS